jgi:DNA-binding transcriptional LysR family regulator
VDIELLRTFLELNRTRHFGRTADNLYLSQSAVSARIRQLEETIGAPLFTRLRHNIDLTAVGHRLLPHAEHIVSGWNQARQEVLLQDVLQSVLSIGGVPSLWDILLEDWLADVYRVLPEVGFTAEVVAEDVLLRKLQEGVFDIGFCFESPRMRGLVAEEISRFPLVMVSSHNGLPTEQALLKDYVMVDWGISFSIWHSRQFLEAPTPRLRLSLGRVARAFLLKNGGTAYLPEPMVRRDLKAKRLFRVKGAPTVERPAHVIYSDNSDKAGVRADALSCLRKVISRNFTV